MDYTDLLGDKYNGRNTTPDVPTSTDEGYTHGAEDGEIPARYKGTDTASKSRTGQPRKSSSNRKQA